MKSSINASWKGNMSFEAKVGDHKIILDADKNSDGQNLGLNPKSLMMVALAGCTGMDVVSILKKMRVDFDDLNIKVEGELNEEHPKYYNKMKVIYEFTGNNLSMEKLQKAVSLSEERYCGVRANYIKSMELSSEIKIIEK